ncbi:MAG: energy transducer TonB [Bacteroidota bacterium]
MIRLFLFVLPLVGCLTTLRAQVNALNKAADNGQAVFDNIAGEKEPISLLKADVRAEYISENCTQSDPYERRVCQEIEMLSFIHSNLIYPQEAKDKNIEGMAVVRFIIEEDGSITNYEIIRDPGGGTGEEALTIVEIMSERGPVFTPSYVDNKPVRSYYNLPIRFRLR